MMLRSVSLSFAGSAHALLWMTTSGLAWASTHQNHMARDDNTRSIYTEDLKDLLLASNLHRQLDTVDLISLSPHDHRDLLHGHDHHHHPHHHEGPCGTPGRTAAQRQSFKKRRLVYHAQRENKRRLGDHSTDVVVVPVCFHVIRPEQDEDDPPVLLDNDLLQIQLDFLNHGFSSQSCCTSQQDWCQEGLCSIDTGIRFEMAMLDETTGQWNDTIKPTSPRTSTPNACVTQTRNSDWYNAIVLSNAENMMMSTLRVGGAGVLNVVYNDLRYYYGMEDRLLGHALLPEWYPIFGAIDGVVISMNGIVYPDEPEKYQYDITLTHEVGHWLGLEVCFFVATQELPCESWHSHSFARFSLYQAHL